VSSCGAASEIVKFWSAADADRVEFSSLLKLLLLTGCRLNEVAGMRSAELSDHGATWNIPGERTKNGRPHVVPLAPLAGIRLLMCPGATNWRNSSVPKTPINTITKTRPTFRALKGRTSDMKVTAGDTLKRAMRLMTNHRVRNLIVITNGQLVSIGDVVKYQVSTGRPGKPNRVSYETLTLQRTDNRIAVPRVGPSVGGAQRS
jgi:Phage integrase family